MRFLSQAFALMTLLLLLPSSAMGREPLPPESELESHHLLLFVHGYLARSASMDRLVDTFAREGIPADWLEPGLQGKRRYHVHSFDFSFFTHAGSDHNVSVSELGQALTQFYDGLPATCPICRSWASRPLDVTVIAHSFGGIVAREFLLQEADRGHSLASRLPGASYPQESWRVSRLITTGSPFFGSARTRYAQGLQSILVNGIIRTGIMGFVRPERAGAYGGVIDAQARALRLGSPYLWQAYLRWQVLANSDASRSQPLPPWLVVTGVGKGVPELSGDGVTRFPSANLAPLLPGQKVETFISNVPHKKLVRLRDGGRLEREQTLLLRAMTLFVEFATLAHDPTGVISPYLLTSDASGARVLVPEAALRSEGSNAGEGSLTAVSFPSQRVYFQSPQSADPVAMSDLEAKRDRLSRVLESDRADLWLRFYDALPGPGPDHPRVFPLRHPLSFFQNAAERSRLYSDMALTYEENTEGVRIPTVYELHNSPSHLISIPDFTPSGPYRMYIRLKGGVLLTSEDVLLQVEGDGQVAIGQPPDGPGIPLYIRPQQANLIHIYLDVRGILARHPSLDRVVIKELALEPEPARSRPRR